MILNYNITLQLGLYHLRKNGPRFPMFKSSDPFPKSHPMWLCNWRPGNQKALLTSKVIPFKLPTSMGKPAALLLRSQQPFQGHLLLWTPPSPAPKSTSL